MAKYKIIPSSRIIVQSPISIGHKAEKGVEAIEFDLTAWVETYGSGTATIVMKRWGDSIPYPVALEIDENNKATWTLSDTDTAKAGMAYAQLSYIVGDEVVKKSDIYTFRVMDSLTGEGEPPEAYESWLEHLTHLAAEAMAEVLDIEGIVTDKTLTVDGGIADAKAAGDALALKADKSTTYTKTEVDQMIEDVEVETDTTLTISGAPADAKATGDALSALEDQFSEETDQLKADLADVLDAHFSFDNLGATTKIELRGISNAGGIIYDAEKTLYRYPVAEGDLLHLSLSSNSGASTAVWVFKSGNDMSTANVGDVHFDSIDGFIRVPTGANYIAVAQTTGSSFEVQRVVPKDYRDEISDIASGAYEKISGDFGIGSILNGNNSSTTTRVRHITPVKYDRDIFVFVKNGYKFYVAFYSDAQGTTFLYTRELVTNNLPIIIKANTYFRMVICKTTEETVVDIDEYKMSIYVTTQLFNNPQIYKNPLVRQVAHQGLSSNPASTTGYNLAESYANAGLAGFTHGECDIVFSSDGVPFCSHDASFTDLTTGDTITINSKTAEELKTYNYHGGTIATFDEVVKTCKTHGMGIYIDHLDGGWTQTQWDALFSVVQKYNMAKNAFWLLPSTSSVLTNPITTWYKDANFCRVLTTAPSNFAEMITYVKALKTEANIVSFDFYSGAVSAEDMSAYMAQLPPELEMEIWTVDSVSAWQSYLPYVSGITSNRICANIARQL